MEFWPCYYFQLYYFSIMALFLIYKQSSTCSRQTTIALPLLVVRPQPVSPILTLFLQMQIIESAACGLGGENIAPVCNACVSVCLRLLEEEEIKVAATSTYHHHTNQRALTLNNWDIFHNVDNLLSIVAFDIFSIVYLYLYIFVSTFSTCLTCLLIHALEREIMAQQLTNVRSHIYIELSNLHIQL